VVAPGDGAALAATLRRLRSDPATCSAYGARARRLLESEYDLKLVAAKWVSLLNKLETGDATDGKQQ
jgi:glycosyltransferase involved in cell wall biosynthesis